MASPSYKRNMPAAVYLARVLKSPHVSPPLSGHAASAFCVSTSAEYTSLVGLILFLSYFIYKNASNPSFIDQSDNTRDFIYLKEYNLV